jgi:hypothetical protein
LPAVKELIIKDLDEAEKQHALRLLDKADQSDPVVGKLKQLLESMEAKPVKSPSILSRARSFLKNLYIKLVSTKIFAQLLISFFSVYALINLINVFRAMPRPFGFADWGELLSSIVVTLFIARGVNFLREGKRLVGYEQFRHALLVSMFFTQFFLFMQEQLSAVVALLISGAVYTACYYLIAQEKEILHEQLKDPEKILQKSEIKPLAN